MTEFELAQSIPAEYRKHILKVNLLSKLHPNPSDKEVIAFVEYLAVIWKTYFNQDLKPNCGYCFEKMVNDFKKLQLHFIRIEEEERKNMMIAKLIPAEERKEILQLNLLSNVTNVNYNATMVYLVSIWKKCIDPFFQMDSDEGNAKVLKCFKDIESSLIELEKEANILSEV